ncbi:PAS domain-containing sensor histidine kinase [Ideonella livida]|uniref:histidine kinase n=1 Tax=Ideonella livida TaxID=2707176 RepID=A0A7C9TLQ5_9BURK|nr:PAS domain-containing sensor histidine kinase [Ideonella livida]NDY92205.1 PAS domain S-box protein [Ideonella livida]
MSSSPLVSQTYSNRLSRLAGRWWRRQSPSRQDRFATIGPLVSVLLFLAAITAAFWYLRSEEIERSSGALHRDTEVAQQQIRLHLIENQEQLVRMAREVVTRDIDAEAFLAQAASFQVERPEVRLIAWVNGSRRVRALHDAQNPSAEGGDELAGPHPSLPRDGASTEVEETFMATRLGRQPVYSPAYRGRDGEWVFQIQVPLLDRGNFSGALLVEYSVEAMLRYLVPAEVTRRHAIAVLNGDQTLAGTVTPMPGRDRPAPALVYELPLTPAANGLVLKGQGYRTSIGLIGNTLFWMVVALSVLTLWMLLGTWRHVRRRTQIQNALVQETNFRRAMENSMLTGMRAMDMDGRVTYVNPAFCAMTGYTESELLNGKPPFPYWPPDRIEENSRLLQQELQGRSPAGGIEVKVMRKDGSVFDARMYVSPLIDPKGHQTGWMTSMTNITEAKRIRDQLSASHERFTTVLEGLEAAVSVLSVQQGELLFCNRSYRLWFGADAKGHSLLANTAPPTSGTDAEDPVDTLSGLPTQELTEAGGQTREVYVEALQMWFDVRGRYLQWTDGRLAHMIIATDITTRLQLEEQARQQEDRAQVASRLITMGEMASSVAHELNQPLTAITNYCNGMVSRVRAGSIGQEDLVAALQKTAKQAERAGQVIHRIRNFVKRSGPQRQSVRVQTIVDDALELASIELKRRKVALQNYVAQRLPELHVDPILIEQVLLNLLKNAAEAIDMAQMPASRRNIELRVVPRHTPEDGGAIEFSVTDMGPGMSEEALARLFEAFHSTKAEGMGIGLSLCRSIIESHQGRMKAQNLYNGSTVVGCRMTFTLPVDLSQRADVPNVPEVPDEAAASNPNAASS